MTLVLCSQVVAYATAFPGSVAMSTAICTWMGNGLRNTATAEPMDGVSVWHLIADKLLTCSRQKIP
jgi:hypothetical protein